MSGAVRGRGKQMRKKEKKVTHNRWIISHKDKKNSDNIYSKNDVNIGNCLGVNGMKLILDMLSLLSSIGQQTEITHTWMPVWVRGVMGGKHWSDMPIFKVEVSRNLGALKAQWSKPWSSRPGQALYQNQPTGYGQIHFLWGCVPKWIVRRASFFFKYN